MNEKLNCKFADLTALYAGKLLWGMDCNIDALVDEILEIYGYIAILDILKDSNNCEVHIPNRLKQKIDSYIKLINRSNSNFCNNC